MPQRRISLDEQKAHLLIQIRQVFTATGFDVSKWSNEQIHAAVIAEANDLTMDKDALKRAFERLSATSCAP